VLTGQIKKFDDVDAVLKQFKFPRFEEENFIKNLQFVDMVAALAQQKGCTPAQLAINWTRALSQKPGMPVIIPIPGSTTKERVEENSKTVNLADEDLSQIDDILSSFTPSGERWHHMVPMNT
jgi:pyridoxine 4-dehydrogenase